MQMITKTVLILTKEEASVLEELVWKLEDLDMDQSITVGTIVKDIVNFADADEPYEFGDGLVVIKEG